MNRHAPAVMVSALMLGMAGCAHDRAAEAMPEPYTPTIAPPAEPVRASINQGKIPADVNTVRASYEPDPADDPKTATAPKQPAVQDSKVNPSEPPKAKAADSPTGAKADSAMSLRTD